MSTADERKILNERARNLAKEPPRTDLAGGCLEVVVFRLASEEYGVESPLVHEVFSLRAFTELPGTPSFVLGIVNLRGRILSVIDLKKFFGLPEEGLGELNKILVIKDDSMEFGILADGIIGVRRIALASIQPSVPTVTGIGGEFVKGVTEERLIVLEAKRILRDERIVIRDEVD